MANDDIDRLIRFCTCTHTFTSHYGSGATCLIAGCGCAKFTTMLKDNDILNKQQVAELLQVSERQVQRWIADRKLKASRPSHKVLRILREDVNKFLERSRT